MGEAALPGWGGFDVVIGKVQLRACMRWCGSRRHAQVVVAPVVVVRSGIERKEKKMVMVAFNIYMIKCYIYVIIEIKILKKKKKRK